MSELGEFATFSVVGRCPRTGDFGVAVATARPAVGSVVPWAGDAGAVATQARTNTALGRGALALLAADPDRDHRQAHGVDRRGGVFAHTGAACVPWCGHRPGEGFSVAGNMLTGPEVLASNRRRCSSRRPIRARITTFVSTITRTPWRSFAASSISPPDSWRICASSMATTECAGIAG